MANKNKTMSAQIFTEFCATIAEFVANNAKQSYLSPKDISGQWRTTVPYSEDFEKELLRQAKLFVILIPSNDHLLLKAVILKVADFLSEYTVKKDQKMSHNAAAEQIVKVLWDDNHRIQQLLAKSQERYERRHSGERHVSNQYEQVKKRARIKQNIINITVYNFQR